MPDSFNENIDENNNDFNDQNPSELYPIFPISNAIFFPKTIIPLHVFEARYRKLIKDIQEFGDKKFVLCGLITTSKPIVNSQPDSIGVIAELIEEEKLPDGRSNIVVMIHERVKIKDYFRVYDILSDDYAIAEISYFPEEPIDSNCEQWHDLRRNLFLEFKTHFEKMTKHKLGLTEESIAESFTPEQSINTACNITLLNYSEKQALLNINSLYERGLKILEIYKKMNRKSFQ